jgi:hypothetical protein
MSAPEQVRPNGWCVRGGSASHKPSNASQIGRRYGLRESAALPGPLRGYPCGICAG